MASAGGRANRDESVFESVPDWTGITSETLDEATAVMELKMNLLKRRWNQQHIASDEGSGVRQVDVAELDGFRRDPCERRAIRQRRRG